MKRNKSRKYQRGILIVILLAAVAGLAVTGLFYFKVNRELVETKQELETWKEKYKAMRTEQRLSQEQEKAEQQEQSAEESEETQNTQTTQEFTFSVRDTAPGIIVESSQIDTQNLMQYFTAESISASVYSRINGKSYRENADISLSELRYLKVLHYNFEHQIQVGEMIVNTAIAQDVQEIFEQLFENEYEIQSIYLVDNYWLDAGGNASDSNSIEFNNTSAFNYREVSGMTGTGTSSNHALGLAIDLNPQQNPDVTYTESGPVYTHKNASPYINRESGADHMITHEDLSYKLFTQYGFTWGGDWTGTVDYQHFEKTE